jgi:hypothetical protein
MEKQLSQLSLISKDEGVGKAVMEAAVFLAIRCGAKGVMVVNAETYQLLAGHEIYDDAVKKGLTDVEVLLCDPDSPAIAELAALNADPAKEALKNHKEYGMVEDPWSFERDPEHSEYLPYDNDATFEGIEESYRKYGKVFPVCYVEVLIDGMRKKFVVDGMKYVLHARKEGLKQVFACRLKVGNNDDLLSLLVQLQRSSHGSFQALFHMIMALWPKYYRGQGFRSDLQLTDEELNTHVLGPDGKRLTIYQRVGLAMNLAPSMVYMIRKIGLIIPRQLVEMEAGRTSPHKATCEAKRKEKGELPPAPEPEEGEDYSPDDQEPGGDGDTNSEELKEEAIPELPTGTVVIINDEFVVVRVTVPCCNKQVLIKIPKDQLGGPGDTPGSNSPADEF